MVAYILPNEWQSFWRDKVSDRVEDDPVLFVLIGLPGSGKSTWAQMETWKKATNYQIVSTDYFIELYAKMNKVSYGEALKCYYKEAKKQVREQSTRAFKAKQNIIWDQTNQTLKARRRALSDATIEYYKVAIVFEPPYDDWQNRLRIRRERTGKIIPPSAIHQMQDMYIPPDTDEGFHKIFYNTGANYEAKMKALLENKK